LLGRKREEKGVREGEAKCQREGEHQARESIKNFDAKRSLESEEP